MRNIVPNLVCAPSGRGVKTVMVAGNVLVQDGVVLTAHEEAVLGEAHAQAEVVAQQVVADPVHGGMALMAAMKTGQL